MRPSVSHNGAAALCAAQGKGLCSSSQLCPGGSAFDGGVTGSTTGDTWVPVTDGPTTDEWLQYGASSGTRCVLHRVTYSPDPHPCHTHPDPAAYPDAAGCSHSAVYCCGAGCCTAMG